MKFNDRIISLALLCYVYHEHWLEVGGDSVRLAVLETVPYALVVILVSMLLTVFITPQWHCYKTS
jgi:hypothetical protein